MTPCHNYELHLKELWLILFTHTVNDHGYKWLLFQVVPNFRKMTVPPQLYKVTFITDKNKIYQNYIYHSKFSTTSKKRKTEITSILEEWETTLLANAIIGLSTIYFWLKCRVELTFYFKKRSVSHCRKVFTRIGGRILKVLYQKVAQKAHKN